MSNSLIIALIFVILFIAIRSVAKKAKNKSSCCSSGTYKASPRKLTQVVARKNYAIEGMHCQHCVNRVMEAINSINGVSAVVNFKKGTATVSMETVVDEQIIIAAVEKAGYTIKAI